MREARKKKEQEAIASNASSSELSSSSEDGDDVESYRVHSKKDKKGKGKKNDDNKYAIIFFNYSSMSMINHDRKSFINVPGGSQIRSRRRLPRSGPVLLDPPLPAVATCACPSQPGKRRAQRTGHPPLAWWLPRSGRGWLDLAAGGQILMAGGRMPAVRAVQVPASSCRDGAHGWAR